MLKTSQLKLLQREFQDSFYVIAIAFKEDVQPTINDVQSYISCNLHIVLWHKWRKWSFLCPFIRAVAVSFQNEIKKPTLISIKHCNKCEKNCDCVHPQIISTHVDIDIVSFRGM